jgi:protein-disulfide isomerase
MAAGVVLCATAFVVVSPRGCAMPNGCPEPPHRPAPAAVEAPTPTPPVAVVPKEEPKPAVAGELARPVQMAHPAARLTNFKEFGSPAAPVVCEIYTDYECPSCAMLYRETVPLLMEQYVATGKVRLVHRDFPLTQHPYSRLAARYANAAGEIGQYEPVVNQIFRTQSLWAANGNIEAQVAQVLSPEQLRKVREMVADDQRLEGTVNADLAMGLGTDHVTQTPTLVIVVNGKRQQIGGVPQFWLLRSYLDQVK